MRRAPASMALCHRVSHFEVKEVLACDAESGTAGASKASTVTRICKEDQSSLMLSCQQDTAWCSDFVCMGVKVTLAAPLMRMRTGNTDHGLSCCFHGFARRLSVRALDLHDAASRFQHAGRSVNTAYANALLAPDARQAQHSKAKRTFKCAEERMGCCICACDKTRRQPLASLLQPPFTSAYRS